MKTITLKVPTSLKELRTMLKERSSKRYKHNADVLLQFTKDIILSNCVGVIDSGYRGEIMAKFKPAEKFNCGIYKIDNKFHKYEVGERIAQLIIMPIPEIEFEEVEELSDSERGTGGYGSSGL